MFAKIVAIAALAVIANAVEYGHHATSYAAINSYNNHVQHVAPAIIKAHIAHPVVHHVAPIVHHEPIVHHVAPVVHHVAPVVHHVAPVAIKAAPVIVKAVEAEHYAYPKYSFKYGVEDQHTHDIKSQEESRDGDVVKGHYSLLQPDGRTRIVHYSADKHNGFQANVEYSGHAAHPEVAHKIIAAPVVHKVIAAPIVHKTIVAAPVFKAAPVYKIPAYPHF